jgi:hypothetical protein
MQIPGLVLKEKHQAKITKAVPRIEIANFGIGDQ